MCGLLVPQPSNHLKLVPSATHSGIFGISPSLFTTLDLHGAYNLVWIYAGDECKATF